MQGQLFSQDFLHRGIRDTPPWQELGDAALQAFSAALHGIFAPLAAHSALNEAQTELRRTHGWFYYRFHGGESPADCFDRTSEAQLDLAA